MLRMLFFLPYIPSLARNTFFFLSEIEVHHWITYVCVGGPSYFHYHFCHSAMVSNGHGSLQLGTAAPTASTMSTTVATADDIDVHRHESRDPLRPRVDLSAGKKKTRQKTLAALNRVVIFRIGDPITLSLFN